jgi:hypothetical protein
MWAPIAAALAALAVLDGLDAAHLGDKPAMSWRNWNYYRGNITQEIMEAQMKALVKRDRTVWGMKGLVSLSDVGFTRTGLDDNWQECHGGFQGAFHDVDGNPLVNESRFPDMKAMVDFGHSLNLTVGWYINNWYVLLGYSLLLLQYFCTASVVKEAHISTPHRYTRTFWAM